MKFFCRTIISLLLQATIDILLGKWRRTYIEEAQAAGFVEKRGKTCKTRDIRRRVSIGAAELAPCCTKTKWRHIIPHLPPVTSVKNTGTRREIARVRHESSFISCYKRRRRAVSVSCTCRPLTRVCVSPRERRNDAGLVDAGLLSHQNRFTWPASDKSSPGHSGIPLIYSLYDSARPLAYPPYTFRMFVRTLKRDCARQCHSEDYYRRYLLEIPGCSRLIRWNFMSSYVSIIYFVIVIFIYTQSCNN